MSKSVTSESIEGHKNREISGERGAEDEGKEDGKGNIKIPPAENSTTTEDDFIAMDMTATEDDLMDIDGEEMRGLTEVSSLSKVLGGIVPSLSREGSSDSSSVTSLYSLNGTTKLTRRRDDVWVEPTFFLLIQSEAANKTDENFLRKMLLGLRVLKIEDSKAKPKKKPSKKVLKRDLDLGSSSDSDSSGWQ
ncbi:hypothetical protein TrLO_g10744 [Triparma laevis f. longispina]|uniref:Uncharacterized protein n=1 Tax=Triparma laevis f. longispina TaxID=1714387 RepID=A0A9W6ZWL0_9STRA|nr:hypothetical protein TrLO_g10744 [Triparma laevis f. longispina]